MYADTALPLAFRSRLQVLAARPPAPIASFPTPLSAADLVACAEALVQRGVVQLKGLYPASVCRELSARMTRCIDVRDFREVDWSSARSLVLKSAVFCDDVQFDAYREMRDPAAAAICQSAGREVQKRAITDALIAGGINRLAGCLLRADSIALYGDPVNRAVVCDETDTLLIGAHQDAGHIAGDFLTLWSCLQYTPGRSSQIYFFSQKLDFLLTEPGGATQIGPDDLPQHGVLAPEIEVGDAFLFDPLCLHGTYVQPHFDRLRLSFDARLIGTGRSGGERG